MRIADERPCCAQLFSDLNCGNAVIWYVTEIKSANEFHPACARRLTVSRRTLGLRKRRCPFVHGTVLRVKVIRRCDVLIVRAGGPDRPANRFAHGLDNGTFAAHAWRKEAHILWASRLGLFGMISSIL